MSFDYDVSDPSDVWCRMQFVEKREKMEEERTEHWTLMKDAAYKKMALKAKALDNIIAHLENVINGGQETRRREQLRARVALRKIKFMLEHNGECLDARDEVASEVAS